MLVRVGKNYQSLLNCLSVSQRTGMCCLSAGRLSWALLPLLFNRISLLNLIFFGQQVGSVFKRYNYHVTQLSHPSSLHRRTGIPKTHPPSHSVKNSHPRLSRPPLPAAGSRPPHSHIWGLLAKKFLSIFYQKLVVFFHLTNSVVYLINLLIFDQGQKIYIYIY